MQVRELQNHLNDLEIDYPVLLANRRRESEVLPNSDAMLFKIGSIELDDEDFDMVPDWDEIGNPNFASVFKLRDWLNKLELGSQGLILNIVVKRGSFEDDSTISLKMPAVATLEHHGASEFWIAVGPQEDWPREWFGT